MKRGVAVTADNASAGAYSATDMYKNIWKSTYNPFEKYNALKVYYWKTSFVVFL